MPTRSGRVSSFREGSLMAELGRWPSRAASRLPLRPRISGQPPPKGAQPSLPDSYVPHMPTPRWPSECKSDRRQRQESVSSPRLTPGENVGQPHPAPTATLFSSRRRGWRSPRRPPGAPLGSFCCILFYLTRGHSPRRAPGFQRRGVHGFSPLPGGKRDTQEKVVARGVQLSERPDL